MTSILISGGSHFQPLGGSANYRPESPSSHGHPFLDDVLCDSVSTSSSDVSSEASGNWVFVPGRGSASLPENNLSSDPEMVVEATKVFKRKRQQVYSRNFRMRQKQREVTNSIQVNNLKQRSDILRASHTNLRNELEMKLSRCARMEIDLQRLLIQLRESGKSLSVPLPPNDSLPAASALQRLKAGEVLAGLALNN